MKKVLSITLAVIMLLAMMIPSFSAEKKKEFLSLGDSIAAGAGLFDPANQVYGAIVSKTNGYNFKNDAISGHTTQMMYARINEPKVAEDIENADIICISIGGNNFLLGNLPKLVSDSIFKDDYTLLDEIASDYYGELDRIMGYIKSLNSDAVILLQTLYNPMYIAKPLRNAYQEGANKLNAIIYRYAEDHPGTYTVVEVGAAFGDDESLITIDYIHPNSKGHVVIAGEVLKTLKELGLGENTEPVYTENKLSTIYDKVIFTFRKVMNVLFFFVK